MSKRYICGLINFAKEVLSISIQNTLTSLKVLGGGEGGGGGYDDKYNIIYNVFIDNRWPWSSYLGNFLNLQVVFYLF